MSETYEQKMMRLSRLHYLNDNSDFARTSVEEFETWKGQLGRSEDEQYTLRKRRIFLEKYFQSIVEHYGEEEIPVLAMLQLLVKGTTTDDCALLGRFVLEAFGRKPLPNKRFLVAPYLKSHAKFLKWKYGEWSDTLKGTTLQNKIRAELEEYTGRKISGATLEDWLKPETSEIE